MKSSLPCALASDAGTPGARANVSGHRLRGKQISSRRSGTNRQHRTGGIANHGFGHAAEQKMSKTRAPVGRNHYQVGVKLARRSQNVSRDVGAERNPRVELKLRAGKLALG